MAKLILDDPDDPVLGRRRREREDTEWHSLLKRAKSKPGRWWRVDPHYNSPRTAANAAYEINAGRNQSLPEGQWEACSRSRELPNGSVIGVLWVRYLGRG